MRKKKDKNKRWEKILSDPSGEAALKDFRSSVKKVRKGNKAMKKKDKKPHRDLHHLTMLLKYTERNVTGDGSYLDELFNNQAERLRKQIEELGK